MPDPEKPSMKERILETADRLFYLQGIRAVGVDTVAAEIGISKRTLYNHFPSKDALISAYLERRFRPIPPSDKPPAEQILRTFDRLERGFADKGFRGCPFVNAVAELGSGDADVKKIAIAFKESRRAWFRNLLKQLDVANAEGLATQLTLLVDGAIAQDLVRNDPSMARAAKAAARVLLKNAGISVDEPDAGAKAVAKKRAPKPTAPSSPRTRGPIRRDRAV
jgi:AcrR family transcriptional regulator